MSIIFYIADLETTGLNEKRNEICELSIIRASDRMQLSREIKVDRPQDASYDALKIIGKTMDDLRRGITKLEMINLFHEFIEEDGVNPSHRCLVGHNIPFDRKFFYYMWGKYNRNFPFHLYLDTISMLKEFYKKQGIKSKANLTAACKTMGIIKRGKDHTAKSDTQNTFILWQKLSENVDFMNHIKCIPHIIE